MKANELYKVVRAVLGPWCKAQGFQKTGTLGWYAPIDGVEYVTFWFQISRDGWDAHAGGKLVVEFQRATSPEAGAVGVAVKRKRLAGLLTEAELESVRAMQNDVIRKLRKPSPNPFDANPGVATWYAAKFEPVNKPFGRGEDVWLRYKEEEDVRRWAQFVLDRLPAVLARMAPEMRT